MFRPKTSKSGGDAPRTEGGQNGRFDRIRELAPRHEGQGLSVGIVMSRFNQTICEGLLSACVDELLRLGVAAEDITLATVPGALEIPLVLRRMAESGRFDALVALGAVIRGETYHFELVSNEQGRPDHRERGSGHRPHAAQGAGMRRGRGRDGEPAEGPGMSNQKARRKAREFALQGIYQWLISGNGVALIEEHIAQADDFDKADQAFFTERLRGTIARAEVHDIEIARHIDRKVDELSPVEHAVLLLATEELATHIDVPYRVVINEAIELTKAFGGSEGHRFVNGVLDKMAAVLRAVEVEAAGRNKKGK